MKTSGTKKTEKSPVELPDTEKAVKKGMVKKSVYKPAVEEIRQKAEEIYHQRVDRGQYGTPEGDWHAAEDYFRKLEVKVS